MNVCESPGDPFVLLCEKKMASRADADDDAVATQAVNRIRIVIDLISCSSGGAKVADYAKRAMFKT
jgi:hypothetical protein